MVSDGALGTCWVDAKGFIRRNRYVVIVAMIIQLGLGFVFLKHLENNAANQMYIVALLQQNNAQIVELNTVRLQQKVSLEGIKTPEDTTGGVDSRAVELERKAWAAEKNQLTDQIAQMPVAGVASNEPPGAGGNEKEARWLAEKKELEIILEKAKQDTKAATDALAAKAASPAAAAAAAVKFDPHWQHPSVQKSGPQYRLVVCILSGREHKDRRDAIRETWASKSRDEVAIRFAVGGMGCPAHAKGEWDCSADKGDPNDEANNKLTTELEAESKEHGDMVLVDMVDSYRALPQKLRLFYRHLAEKVNYEFVLKIDDDTYVNLDRVLNHLKSDAVPLEETWYGHMRCDWPVNTDGKWADQKYTASKYPCFGGGGGNILSHDLSDWIGINAMHLQDYQGEDVSAGIWLAGRVHSRLPNDHFHALGDEACDPQMASAPEMSIKDFRAMYDRLTKCGGECNRCDKAREHDAHGPSAYNESIDTG